MAKFTPLIGTVTGKIGGLVVGANRTVRMFTKAANRTPAAVKTIFSELAGAWPTGEMAAKQLIMKSPGVSNGVMILTRGTYQVYNRLGLDIHAGGVESASHIVNGVRYGTLPDRLVNLPGEFGEDIVRFPLVYQATVNTIAYRIDKTLIPQAIYSNPRIVLITLSVPDIQAGATTPQTPLTVTPLYEPPTEPTLFGVELPINSSSGHDSFALFSTVATITATGKDLNLGNTLIKYGYIPTP